ncbi:hypothetical protein D3C87_2032830 [compost metagenome]
MLGQAGEIIEVHKFFPVDSPSTEAVVTASALSGIRHKLFKFILASHFENSLQVLKVLG